MPRGQYERKSTTTLAVSGIVAIEKAATLRGWDKLNPQEQTSVIAEGQKLAQSLLRFGQARLQVGEHLTALQQILEPHNLFGRFLDTFFDMSARTAYRYISGYKNAAHILPQPVLKVAMARNVNIIGDTEEKPLGVFTSAAAVLPPPTGAVSEAQANAYIDALEQRVTAERSQRATGTATLPAEDPEMLKREMVQFAKRRFDRLPTNKRTRDKWARETLALLATVWGQSAMTVSPATVPESFIVHRGRPKTSVAQPVAASA
jgi:hypothetical protein